LLKGTPNAKALKEDLMMQQMPHDLKLQRVDALKPKSQMHCELWKVRISSIF
jgi:hypothetical protein